jgi:hypothetical protein
LALVVWALVVARTCFCQSLGSAATVNTGAGLESSIRTTLTVTPKKRTSLAVCSFSQSSA